MDIHAPAKFAVQSSPLLEHARLYIWSPTAACADEILSVDVNEAITHTIFQHMLQENFQLTGISTAIKNRPVGGKYSLSSKVLQQC